MDKRGRMFRKVGLIGVCSALLSAPLMAQERAPDPARSGADSTERASARPVSLYLVTRDLDLLSALANSDGINRALADYGFSPAPSLLVVNQASIQPYSMDRNSLIVLTEQHTSAAPWQNLIDSSVREVADYAIAEDELRGQKNAVLVIEMIGNNPRNVSRMLNSAAFQSAFRDAGITRIEGPIAVDGVVIKLATR